MTDSPQDHPMDLPPAMPVPQPSQRAGKGGVVPPIDHRWKPGVSANPGGLPKGFKHASIRRAMLRALGKGFESDAEAATPDDRLGELSRKLAKEIIDGAQASNGELVRALATIIDQVEGKPQERVEHSGTMRSIVFEGESSPEEAPPIPDEPEASA